MLGGGALEQFGIVEEALIVSSAKPPTPGDLDGDGDVDGADLGLMLGAWGPCDRNCPPCLGDLNGDCAVNGADLGVLLGSWGG